MIILNGKNHATDLINMGLFELVIKSMLKAVTNNVAVSVKIKLIVGFLCWLLLFFLNSKYAIIKP